MTVPAQTPQRASSQRRQFDPPKRSAIALADLLGGSDQVDRWKEQREEIWHTHRARRLEGGSRRLYPLRRIEHPGCLQSDDGDCRPPPPTPGCSQRLLRRGRVYRYRTDDGVNGLAGEEGTFLPCTRWLAQDSRWPIRLIEPRTGCERATAVANDLGLLAEELDPELPSGSATSRKHLVNWPG